MIKKYLISILILIILVLSACGAPASVQAVSDIVLPQIYNCGQQESTYIDEAGNLWGLGPASRNYFGAPTEIIENVDWNAVGIFSYQTPFLIAKNVAAFNFGFQYYILAQDQTLYINDYKYWSHDSAYSGTTTGETPLWLADKTLAAQEEEAVLNSPAALENVIKIGQRDSLGSSGILLSDGTLLVPRIDASDKRKVYQGLLGRQFSVVATGVTDFGNQYYIKSDGSLWVTGYNGYGILGNGSYEELTFDEMAELGLEISVEYHKVMENIKDAAFIPSWTFHSYTGLAVTDYGELYAWGNNEFGQCGNGFNGDGYATTRDLVLEPVKIMDHVKQVFGGTEVGFALTDAGELYAWGNNNYGFLGTGDYNKATSVNGLGVIENSPVMMMTDVKAFYPSGLTFCALKNDDSLWVWGNDFFGQCGIGSEVKPHEMISAGAKTQILPSPNPTKIMEDVRTVSQSSLGYVLYAITNDGKIYGWGDNPFFAGWLGDADVTVVNVPTQSPKLAITFQDGKMIFEGTK